MITIVRSAVGSPVSLGLIKFLKQIKFRIVGTDINEYSVGRKYCDQFYIVPRANKGQEVIDKYCLISKKECAGWIVSGPEEEIILLMRHETVFRDLGVKVFHSSLETLNVVTDKLKLYQFCKIHNISTPHTVVSDSAAKLSGESLILKPRVGRGSAGVATVRALDVRSTLGRISSATYIAQERINGAEYTVDVLCDMQGKVVNIVPRKRLRIDSGVSVVGKTVRSRQLSEICFDICKKLNFSGMNCFQFVQDDLGVYYLIDINPRFGGGAILSIKACSSLRHNLYVLFNGDGTMIEFNHCDFDELVMLRGYEEYYQ